MFTADRVRLLQLLSSQIATSIENSQLFEKLSREIEDRKRAEQALRFLADTGAALAESLDYQATADKAARLAVPTLADWCVVDVVENGQVCWVASAHVDPAKQELLQSVGRNRIGERARRHVTDVFESGTSVLYREVNRAVIEKYATQGEADLKLVENLGSRSSMIVPLKAHGRFLGVMTLVSITANRDFGPTDLSLAEELARRAALAVDNASVYREVQEAVRLRDEFLSVASHELNTPITSLLLLAQGLEQGQLGRSSPALNRTVRLMSRQTRRLASLVSELLEVACVQTGQIRLYREPIELSSLVRRTVEYFDEDAERMKCSVTISAEAPVVGHWDRERLERIVGNLLSNAIKFSCGNPIDITVEQVAGAARVVIEDHGLGIPPERSPYIFGRFERAVSANHYGGLGLGLYIVKQIVDALGGTISVQSVLGTGSRFTLDLPVTNATTV